MTDNKKSKPNTNTTLDECLLPFKLKNKSPEACEFRDFLSNLRSDREQELGHQENLRADKARAWLEGTVFPAVHERFPYLPLASTVDDDRGAAIKRLIGKDKQKENQRKKHEGKDPQLQGMRSETRNQKRGATCVQSKPDVENNTASWSRDCSLDDVPKRSSTSSSELLNQWNDWNCSIEISLVRCMQTPTERPLARVMLADTRDPEKSLSYELWLLALKENFGISSYEITRDYTMFWRTREQHWERIRWDASFWHSTILKKFHEGCTEVLQVEIRESATDIYPQSTCTLTMPTMPVTVTETVPSGSPEHFKGESTHRDTSLNDDVQRAVGSLENELDAAFTSTLLDLSL